MLIPTYAKSRASNKTEHIPSTLDTFFRQIKSFLRFHLAFVFGLQTYFLIDFSKIYQLKGLQLKNKGHTNFYECCDLTEKVYLIYMYLIIIVVESKVLLCRCIFNHGSINLITFQYLAIGNQSFHFDAIQCLI